MNIHKSFCDLTIDEYIKCTANWREGAKTQLLLSYIKPHVEVLSSTVSQWIKQTLKLSGRDITKFKEHSKTTASSSKVGSTTLLVSDILVRSSWSQKSTWQRFYKTKQFLIKIRLFKKMS